MYYLVKEMFTANYTQGEIYINTQLTFSGSKIFGVIYKCVLDMGSSSN